MLGWTRRKPRDGGGGGIGGRRIERETENERGVCVGGQLNEKRRGSGWPVLVWSGPSKWHLCLYPCLFLHGQKSIEAPESPSSPPTTNFPSRSRQGDTGCTLASANRSASPTASSTEVSEAVRCGLSVGRGPGPLPNFTFGAGSPPQPPLRH